MQEQGNLGIPALVSSVIDQHWDHQWYVQAQKTVIDWTYFCRKLFPNHDLNRFNGFLQDTLCKKIAAYIDWYKYISIWKFQLTLQWRYQNLETIDGGLRARRQNIVGLLSWDSHPLTFSHVFEIDVEHRHVQKDLDTVGIPKIDSFSWQLYSRGRRNPWCADVGV